MPAFIDLTGQTFGQLTAETYHGKGRWLCRCECTGKIVVVHGDLLRNGKTKSCGCLKRSARQSLIGQKFGQLIVEKYEGKSRWLCRCECTGKTVVVRGSSLRSGKTKSCGCLTDIARRRGNRRLSLVGRKFGRLTVEKYKGNSRWLCRCECDRRTVTVVKTDALTGGDTRSCGCLHKDRAAARLTARRKKQALARVGQTNAHLRCDAYIGKRRDGNTARHFFHFSCLHCAAKVERPWDNRVQPCDCMKNGGSFYQKVCKPSARS